MIAGIEAASASTAGLSGESGSAVVQARLPDCMQRVQVAQQEQSACLRVSKGRLLPSDVRAACVIGACRSPWAAGAAGHLGAATCAGAAAGRRCWRPAARPSRAFSEAGHRIRAPGAAATHAGRQHGSRPGGRSCGSCCGMCWVLPQKGGARDCPCTAPGLALLVLPSSMA